MEAFAASFVEESIRKERNEESATVLGLKGDLGAGKTTFTKSVAKVLGVEGVVTSPTFVIEKIYKLPQGGDFSYLIHIDAYRLEESRELLVLGWKDLIDDPRNLILVEWPEKVSDILPKDVKILQFKFIDEETREITY